MAIKLLQDASTRGNTQCVLTLGGLQAESTFDWGTFAVSPPFFRLPLQPADGDDREQGEAETT